MNKREAKNQRIQVFARCRPLNSQEKKKSASVIEVVPDKKILLKDKSNNNKEFFFDKVFSPQTKQIDVYKSVVEPLIKEVLMGYNCTVFAYGQTGTGKTYTMEGERSNAKCSWDEDPGAGVVPRSLHQLFEELHKEENVEFSVRVSFLELYNEELFDLLSSTELSRLRLYEDVNRKGSVIIQGLEEIAVNNKDEVYAILEKGSSRRQMASTLLNASSSRSHTVFSVTVHIKENTVDGEELLKTGKLNLVDLAGSENVGRSGAQDKTLREAGNINQSLLTLGRVITSLIEKQPHIPYRESKLTRILQDSLGGHTKTSIIATVSPAQCNMEETQSTLEYATKAKSITIRPEVNQKMTKRALLREFNEEIERLRKDLAAVRNKEGFYIDTDNYENMKTDIQKKESMIKELTDKVEALVEDNQKIEEEFNLTKQELNEACKQLVVLEETKTELSNKTSALELSQMFLEKTEVERDSVQFVSKVYEDKNRKISQEANQLLQVAKKTSSDIDKLHSKIERKTVVEVTNEEKLFNLRETFNQQSIDSTNLVTKMQNTQLQNSEEIKNNLCLLCHNLSECQQLSDKCLTNNSVISSKLEDLSISSNDKNQSQMLWVDNTIHDIGIRKDCADKHQKAFTSERLPVLFDNMKKKVVEMTNCALSEEKIKSLELQEFKNSHATQVESQMNLLNSLCAKRTNFYTDQKKLLEECETKNKQLSESFKQQIKMTKEVFTQIIYQQKQAMLETVNQQMAALTEVLNQQMQALEAKQEQEHNIEISNISKRMEKLKEEQKADDELLNSLRIEVESSSKHLATIDKIATPILHVELSPKEKASLESQNTAKAEIHTFLDSVGNHTAETYDELKLKFEKYDESLVDDIQNQQSNISDILQLNKDMQKDYVHLKEICSAMSAVEERIEGTCQQAISTLNVSTEQLKESIQKTDLKLEKFISEELVKDVPTGTTPQRSCYTYPDTLTVLSPRERILQRFHTKLNHDVPVLALPLDSSFEESYEHEVMASGDSNILVAPNSAASCELTGWESDTSETSDCGGSKNKENLSSLKKSSRLPQLGKFKKPAPVSSQKPLHSKSNNNLLIEPN